jgi:hypothetical protein
VDPDAVINQRASLNQDRARSQSFEFQPGRRDGFEVFRLGKEREHFGRLAWEPKLGMKREFLHDDSKLRHRSSMGVGV